MHTDIRCENIEQDLFTRKHTKEARKGETGLRLLLLVVEVVEHTSEHTREDRLA